MQHKVLPELIDQAFYDLLITTGTQGTGNQRLRFTAREQSRTMRARQQLWACELLSGAPLAGATPAHRERAMGEAADPYALGPEGEAPSAQLVPPAS